MTNTITAGKLPRRTIRYESIVGVVLWLCIASGAIAIVEPSPYDLLSLIVTLLLVLGGFRLHRALLPFLALQLVFNLAGFISLIPYWDIAPYEDGLTPIKFQIYTVYCTFTSLLFAIFYTENSLARLDITLKAYTLSCVLAASVGLLGYFGLLGLASTAPEGRAMGTFKDPNVLGSYCIMGALYLMQNVLLQRTRSSLLSAALLAFILFGGIFLSFSRGSWGALILASTMLGVSSFLSEESRSTKKRILVSFGAIVLLGGLGLGIILSDSTMRDFFNQRAAVAQDYDQGQTGRFGNQLRSIPMLVERPNGFGPLRFRAFFDLDPHNSYVGSFANAGWLGGFSFIGLVLATCYIGFRLMLVPSPFRRQAQVIWPALFCFFLQGFQIDIDHWRFVFLILGAIWGMEAGRQRWLRQERVGIRTGLPA
jgi:hypothetical protein